VTLRCQVIDLIRLHLLHDADEVRGVRQITVVQVQPHPALVWILIQVVDAVGIKGRGAALDAVDLVTLIQQEFRKVGAVLPGNARDQCFFSHNISPRPRRACMQ